MFIKFLLQFCPTGGGMLMEPWGWGYLPCLLAVLVLCSVTLTWDAPLFAPYREHYFAQSHFQGVDVFTGALHSPVGPEQFMENFYVCYGRDGRKTYFKKQDQNYFSNRRFWVISSGGKFVASMRTCQLQFISFTLRPHPTTSCLNILVCRREITTSV